jgi:hypothetical protein
MRSSRAVIDKNNEAKPLKRYKVELSKSGMQNFIESIERRSASKMELKRCEEEIDSLKQDITGLRMEIYRLEGEVRRIGEKKWEIEENIAQDDRDLNTVTGGFLYMTSIT